MIEFIDDGDMLKDAANVLVCPVNRLGVMGAGLAKAFALRFPHASRSYRAACGEGWYTGRVIVGYEDDKTILFAATKHDWRQPSKLEWIVETADQIVEEVEEDDVVACPALGCGLGGLAWADVKSVLEAAWTDGPTRYRVYAPQEIK